MGHPKPRLGTTNALLWMPRYPLIVLLPLVLLQCDGSAVANTTTKGLCWPRFHGSTGNHAQADEPGSEGEAGVRHYIAITVLIVCLVLAVIYGLEPNLTGVTKRAPHDAMSDVSDSIAGAMKYPGPR